MDLKQSPLDDVVQSKHLNLAAALDFLGPGITVSRNYTTTDKMVLTNATYLQDGSVRNVDVTTNPVIL